MTCETDKQVPVTTTTAPETITTTPQTEALNNRHSLLTVGEKTKNKRLKRKERLGLPLRSLPDINHQ